MPTKLIPVIGKRRWRESLGTGDKHDAQRKAQMLAAKHDRDIKDAEHKLKMSPAERAVADLIEAERNYRIALTHFQHIETAEWRTGIDSTSDSRMAVSGMIDEMRAKTRAAIVADGEKKLAEAGAVPAALHGKVRRWAVLRRWWRVLIRIAFPSASKKRQHRQWLSLIRSRRSIPTRRRPTSTRLLP